MNSPGQPSPLILNVDDNEGARYAKTRVLKHAGFSVIEAATGYGALDQIREHAPALVLLDVKLPDISGIEVCEKIKGDPATVSTLVLQTSAAAVQTLDKVRALDGGADSYLTEPIEPAELIANVRALLRLRQAEEALREADRRKDQFLATLAHELRNPLAPIRNAVELMDPRYRADDKVLAEARMIVGRQVAHLSRLVDDLLDVSRITHGKIVLKMEDVDVGTAIANAVEASRPLIDKKYHLLHVSAPQADCKVRGDSVRVAQIIGNLLSNAAKYTPEGGYLELSAALEGDEVVLRVRDNGIGIAPAELNEVFNLFMQSNGAMPHSEEGLGIGLSLVKTLTELHGGTVEARSEGLGKGAEFSVRLRAVRKTGGEAPGPVAKEGAGSMRRVLIADDSVDGAESMSILLETRGHEVCVTFDGLSAIEAAGSFHPDVAILDLGLPGADGYQVARSLRANPDTEGALLIALTGYGQESDRARTRDAGFDGHFVKPALFEDVMRAIDAEGAPGRPRNRGAGVAAAG